MGIYHRSLLSTLIVFLFCIQVACSAVVIESGKNGNGYSWSSDGTIVTITGGYEEYILSKTISESTIVIVNANGVTLNGNRVPIVGIRGQPTLDLVNVRITGGGIFDHPKSGLEGFYGITECRNIKSSSIVLDNIRGYSFGIGFLRGNLDDIIITVIDERAYGFLDVSGEISDGLFTITGKDVAYGVGGVSGEISGGRFAVTGESAYGISWIIENGVVSGGVFTVTGDKSSGVFNVLDGGKISGGVFTITGKNTAYGVQKFAGTISGGVFTVNGVPQRLTSSPQSQLRIGSGGREMYDALNSEEQYHLIEREIGSRTLFSNDPNWDVRQWQQRTGDFYYY